MEEKKSNKLLYGILGAVALILGAAVLLFVILGGSIKTFKGENVQFSPIDDPVCEAVYNFSNQFDKEHLPILKDTLSGCNVTVTYDSEKDLVTSVVVTDNVNGNLVYERHLEEKGDGYYDVNLKYYDAYDNHILTECCGELDDNRVELEQKREDVSYENCFENQQLSYLHDSLYFFNGVYTTMAIKNDCGVVDVTDYWSNGQVKLFKKYVCDDDTWGISEARNYKEDGSEGNPIEIHTLLKGRWMGFSSNLVRTWNSEPIYLILRPSKDDWRKGRVFVCSSGSSCKNDYYFMEKGQYTIDDSDYIKFHSMKNNSGRKVDSKRLKISGSPSRIVLTGSYDKISSRFVSEINVNSRSWFRKSIQSKYKIY